MSKVDIGKKLKDLKLNSTDSKKNKLSDYLDKNLIVYFYPKDMTPGCTTESIEFNENLSKIKRAGWNIIGVSRDSVKSHMKFINTFDVIKEKSLYGRKYMGIDRSTFLLNKKLTILHLWRTVKVKGHVDEVINKIKEIK